MIADEPGLGKTIQSIAVCHHLDAYPVLCIVPASVKLNWAREWKATIPYARPIVLSGRKPTATEGAEILRKHNVTIINYDILAAWADVLTEVGYKAIILDEAHYCFPYATSVITDRGMMAIGDIVEQRANVRALCYNSSSNALEWKPVINHFKHHTDQRLMEVVHEHGRFVATEGHKVWTDGGYMEVAALTRGTILRVVQPDIPNTEEGQSNGALLLSHSCGAVDKQPASNGRQNQQGTDERAANAYMSMVPEAIYSQEAAPLLRQFVCGAVANVAAGAAGTDSQVVHRRAGEQGPQAARCFGADEAQQSDGRSSCGCQDAAECGRENLSVAWRKQQDNGTAKAISGGARLADGIPDCDCTSSVSISIPSAMLQGGHSRSSAEDCDRDRRQFPPYEKMAFSGCPQDSGLIGSRVVSVAVYQPEGTSGTAASCERDHVVYNIEVADHHNYFANGVLVANCKSAKSLRTIAALQLATGKAPKRNDEGKPVRGQYIKVAEPIATRIALTGTPILNRPAELATILRLLDRLDDVGGYWSVVNCTDRIGLNTKLRASCYVRREKRDVLPELPAIQRSRVVVPIDNRKEYDHVERNVIAWIYEQAAKDEAFLASIADLGEEEHAKAVKAHQWSKAATAARAEAIVRIGALKQTAAKGKIAAIKTWVQDFLEAGEPLILFAHHIEVQKALIATFPGCASITGDMSGEARQAAVDRFQNDPGCNLIVCSLRAAREGLTLTRASNVAFCELGWTPAEHDQAEARCYGRMSDLHGANAWYLIAEETIDEDIEELIAEKRALVEAITSGEARSAAAGQSVAGEVVKRLTGKGGKAA